MNLRDYLKSTGLTQQEFGRLLAPPVSQSKVNHWIQGTRRVSLLEALKIERLTGGKVSTADLVPPFGACSSPAKERQEASHV